MPRPQKITFAEMRAIWLSLFSRNTPAFAHVFSRARIHVVAPVTDRHLFDLTPPAGAVINQELIAGWCTKWWLLLENFHRVAHAVCCQKQN
jgi:hypothetical protein